jgi:hypothetical protein
MFRRLEGFHSLSGRLRNEEKPLNSTGNRNCSYPSKLFWRLEGTKYSPLLPPKGMGFKSICVHMLSVGRAVHSACVPDIKQTADMQVILYDEANKWPIKCGKRSCGGRRATQFTWLITTGRISVIRPGKTQVCCVSCIG